MSFGKYQVQVNVERSSGSYTYRDLSLINTKVVRQACTLCVAVGMPQLWCVLKTQRTAGVCAESSCYGDVCWNDM